MANLEQTAVTGIVGLAISIAGNYLISMRRGAESLDTTRATESSELRKQVEQLTPSKPSPREQRLIDEAKTALAELGETGAAAIRHLIRHETQKISPSGSSPFPAGLSERDTQAIMNACVQKNLVTPESSVRIVGAGQPVYDCVYKIAPEMKPILADLLDPRGPAESVYAEKKRTFVEEERLKKIRATIDTHGPNAVSLLKHLRVYGAIETGSDATPVDGIDHHTHEMLSVLKTEGIIDEDRRELRPPPGKAGYLERELGWVRTKSTWRIRPALESAVDEIIG